MIKHSHSSSKGKILSCFSMASRVLSFYPSPPTPDTKYKYIWYFLSLLSSSSVSLHFISFWSKAVFLSHWTHLQMSFCAPCLLSTGLVSVLPVEKPVSPSVFWTVPACCLAALCAGHTRPHGVDPARPRRSHSGWWTGGERWSRLSSLLDRWEEAGHHMSFIRKKNNLQTLLNVNSVVYKWV